MKEGMIDSQGTIMDNLLREEQLIKNIPIALKGVRKRIFLFQIRYAYFKPALTLKTVPFSEYSWSHMLSMSPPPRAVFSP